MGDARGAAGRQCSRSGARLTTRHAPGRRETDPSAWQGQGIIVYRLSPPDATSKRHTEPHLVLKPQPVRASRRLLRRPRRRRSPSRGGISNKTAAGGSLLWASRDGERTSAGRTERGGDGRMGGRWHGGDRAAFADSTTACADRVHHYWSSGWDRGRCRRRAAGTFVGLARAGAKLRPSRTWWLMFSRPRGTRRSASSNVGRVKVGCGPPPVGVAISGGGER